MASQTRELAYFSRRTREWLGCPSGGGGLDQIKTQQKDLGAREMPRYLGVFTPLAEDLQ